MQYLSRSDMVSWCEGFGIRLQTQYPSPYAMSMGDEMKACIDIEARQCLGTHVLLIDALYEGLAVSQFCRVSKRHPGWDYPRQDGQSFNDYLAHILYHADFIPLGCLGSLELVAEEASLVKRLMLAAILTARSKSDDIHIVPDNGEMLLSLDHHGQAYVEFRSLNAWNAFSQILDKYEIPHDKDVVKST